MLALSGAEESLFNTELVTKTERKRERERERKKNR